MPADRRKLKQRRKNKRNATGKAADCSPRPHSQHPPAAKPTEARLVIDRLTYGGRGLGFYQGKAVFVTDTIPGDEVQVTLTKNKARFSEGVPVSWYQRSADRQAAVCDYFDRCGGCQWQMLPYAKQLSWKGEFIRDSLERIANIKWAEPITCRPAPAITDYRNRIQLRGQALPGKPLAIGYYASHSHTLIQIDDCPVAEPPLRQMIPILSQCHWSEENSELNFLLHLQTIQDQEGRPGIIIGVDLTGKNDHAEQNLSRLLENIADLPQVKAAYRITAPPTDYWVYDQQEGLDFGTAAELFQQIHRPANHLLRQLVKDHLQATGARRILDLFCGSGNLSLPLLQAGYQVTGIEIEPRAIEIAKYNCTQNHLPSGDYRAAPSEELESWLNPQHPFDAIIVDPPRAGLGDSLSGLCRSQAETIIYVSCDPTTLARDLKTLTAGHYRLTAIEAFDFFPQTYHVETLAILKRVT